MRETCVVALQLDLNTSTPYDVMGSGQIFLTRTGRTMAKRWLLGLLLLLFACDRARGGVLDDVFDFFADNLGGWTIEWSCSTERTIPRKVDQSFMAHLTFLLLHCRTRLLDGPIASGGTHSRARSGDQARGRPEPVPVS